MTGEAVRVLFVSTAQDGGAERVLEDVVDGLGPDWVAGVALLHEGPLEARLRARGLAVHRVHGGRRRRIAGLRRLLRATRPDVVHANGIVPCLESRIASVGLRVPVVWMRHDLSHRGPVTWVLGNGVRLVVGVSEAAARGTAARPSRRRVVHNALRGPAPDPAAGAAALAALAALGEPTVGVVGRLCPGKGQLEAVEAFAAVRAARPRARLVLVGGEDQFHPGHRARIEERIAALDLGAAVVLAGHRDDARDLIAAVDVLWVPSVQQTSRDRWAEGFGLVAAEGLWAGTPTIVTTNGALPEVVGAAGIVVPEGDPDALARATLGLLEDPAHLDRLRADGPRRAGRFAPEQALRSLADAYLEAVA